MASGRRRARKARIKAAHEWGTWEWRDLPYRDDTPTGERWVMRGALNGIYSVMFSEWPLPAGAVATHLWIRRHDSGVEFPWTHLQRIKDELGYSDQHAIEIFPPKDQIVDQANMRHLWVFPPGMGLAFTLSPGVKP